MIKKLLRFVGEYKKPALWVPLFILIEVVLELVIPLLMARIIDVGITRGDIPYILLVGGLMVLMAAISLVFGVLAGRFASVSATGFGKNVRRGQFARIQSFSFANIDRFSVPSLITRLTADVTNIQQAYMMTLRVAVRAPLLLIGATAMAVMINARLSLIFLVALPLLAIAIIVIGKISFPRFTVMMEKYDKMNGSVQETLIAIRTVKAFVRGRHEKEKFEVSAETLRRFQLRAERVLVYNMPIMQFIIYGTMIAVCWFGGNMMIAGTMLPGEFMSFFSYIMQVLVSLMMLSMVFVLLLLSRASARRILEVVEEEPAIDDRDADPDLRVTDGSVRFEHVDFGYAGTDEALVLRGIDLEIAAGETIGIVGGTGSGKTSFVQLIPRLYDATHGRVSVGGHDVKNYRTQELRERVAMVLQNNVLFSGTIRDNLRWGNEQATDEEIATACRIAQAHDFILAFPDGYDTVLGQGGVNVSGGQKQRLCIARALLKQPAILILDDSTSAVDTATDSSIRTALRENMGDVTVFIIAQRINSVMDCDRIIVLDDGRLDAIGSHEDLLQTNAIYREVYDSQQKGVA